MVEATLVTSLISELKDFLQRTSAEKGEFALAMLLPSTTDLPNKWNLVVSAPWIDKAGQKSALNYLTLALRDALDRESLISIERISAVPIEDLLVQQITRSLKVEQGSEMTVKDCTFGNLAISMAVVLLSNSSAGRKKGLS